MAGKHFYNGLKMGILGGGQLGRMLIQSAIDYNIYSAVLDPDEDAPCKHLCSSFYHGSFNDFDTVMGFGKDLDIITIEIEHVNVGALEVLQKMGKKVFPEPRIIRMVQDKGLQKQFFKNNDIPTSDFVLVENKEEILQHAHFLPVFQKNRLAGYDGRGVKKIATINDIPAALEGASVLEKQVDYVKEISIVCARNPLGETAFYSPVEMVLHPTRHLLEFMIAPAEISEEASAKALHIASQIIEKLDYVGILAIEMFVDAEDNVLVNEMAPRPHNSGHHTIEACITSQYNQHIRAIFGLPLGSTADIMPSAMLNLLGEEGYSGDAVYEGIEEAMKIQGVYVHLYGKAKTKPFRKMGHVTILGEDKKALIEKVNIVRNLIKVKA